MVWAMEAGPRHTVLRLSRIRICLMRGVSASDEGAVVVTRHRFYIGELEKDGVTPVPKHVWDEINWIIGDAFGGFTCLRGFGVWEEKQEPSRIYECLTESFSSDAIKQTLVGCRDLANQTCILWTYEEVQGEFV